jgi:DNA modification methylase
VSSDFKLLDGKHRWLGYRTAFENEPDREIRAFVYPATTAHEQFQIAVELNSQHGYQLTDEDKRQCAITMFGMNLSYDTIAKRLSVGKRKVAEWLSRTVKETKERQAKQIWEMYLACHTQEEIAEAVELTQQRCAQKMQELQEQFHGNQTSKSLFCEEGYAPPLYNVWTANTKTNEVSHFGNSEQRWLENLLYLYTDPLDIVVDPFGGGGSTIDVCKRRARRYFVSDRKPIAVREKEIRKHDITDGLPPLPRWKDVKLVFLDPPYWKQAEGQYSTDSQDLANMSIEDFNKHLASLVHAFAKKLTDAYIALIIQPTQWKSPERKFIDHVGDMLRAVKLPVDMRYSVPYTTEQYNAQQVEWAKEHRKALVITREIVVWKV